MAQMIESVSAFIREICEICGCQFRRLRLFSSAGRKQPLTGLQVVIRWQHMSTGDFETLSVKVPRRTKQHLRAAARKRGTTPSRLLRQALDRVVAGENEPGGQASLFERNRDLIARPGRGPKDLSTNKAHLDNLGA